MKLRENSMFLLYLISGILAYAHKIPFIGRMITLLSLWYGRTTWWKILVKLRKLFIIFNAVIGVYMVFKTVGFSFDNIAAGFAGMGHTYLEILVNFTKRLFNWFVELFDHKIVPNVPGNNGGSLSKLKHIWTPIDKSVYHPTNILPDFSLRELYKNPSINITTDSTPWYKSLNTLLWIGGIICSVGVLYTGYKFLTDPAFLINHLNMPDATGPTNPNVGPGYAADPNVGAAQPDISLTERLSDFSKNIVAGGQSVITKTSRVIRNNLNPFTWFISSAAEPETNAQLQSFIDRQNNLVTSDIRLYPFTEYNPHDSWLTKLRISWLGETSYEISNRLRAKALALSEMELLRTNISPASSGSGSLTPVRGMSVTGFLTPGFGTPSMGTIGLGTRFVSGTGLIESVEASSSYQNVFDKISSLPPTPKTLATALPNLADQVGTVNPSWTEHSVNKEELLKYSEKVTDLKTKVDTSLISAAQPDKYPISKNKFEILGEKQI